MKETNLDHIEYLRDKLIGAGFFCFRCYATAFLRLTWIIRDLFKSFMRGNGFQIAALAREIAAVKGRLAYLLESERRHRSRNWQEGGATPLVTQPVPAGAGGFASSGGQFAIVCTFVAGLFCGGLVTSGAICLGIWIGHLL